MSDDFSHLKALSKLTKKAFDVPPAAAKKPRKARKSGPTTDLQMRKFVIDMTKRFPSTMGGDSTTVGLMEEKSISGMTLLAKVISALSYVPSSRDVLHDPEAYIDRYEREETVAVIGADEYGVPVTAVKVEMVAVTVPMKDLTFRQMLNQCSYRMLYEIENALASQELNLLQQKASANKYRSKYDITADIVDEREPEPLVTKSADKDWGSW